MVSESDGQVRNINCSPAHDLLSPCQAIYQFRSENRPEACQLIEMLVVHRKRRSTPKISSIARSANAVISNSSDPSRLTSVGSSGLIIGSLAACAIACRPEL